MLARVSNIILKISEPRNVSQIIVTHQITDAFHLTKRFIMIDSGQIIFDGGGNQLLKSQNENIIKFLRPFNASMARHYEMLEEVNNKS